MNSASGPNGLRQEDAEIEPSDEALPALPTGRAPVLHGCAPDTRSFAVITTGRLEERVWRRRGPAGPAIARTAGSTSNSIAAIEGALRKGVSGILSFGVAAALAPAIEPGQLVLADAVALPEGGSRPTDAPWRDEVQSRLEVLGLDTLVARIAGAETIPGHRYDRGKCFRQSFAAALDTESHLVAEAAHRRGLPFMALRVVIDDLSEPSLGTDLLTMTAAGRWRRGIAPGLRRPWHVAKVVRAARGLEQGLQVLARALPAIDGPPATLAYQ